MKPLNTEKERIKCFLQEIKDTITAPHAGYQTWTLVPRTKNCECLAKLGYTLKDVRLRILELTVKNYVRGPFTDRNERGEFWEFGKTIDGYEIYIKLKLASFDKLKAVRIVSFHIAEAPIQYPVQD